MTITTGRYVPYYEGLENGDRLARPIWGMPGPAIETTFDGERHVLDCEAQMLAVQLVNRRAFRHDVGRRAHAQATLLLAAKLGVNTYLAGLIAEWVSPDHCGIGWRTGRIRILSREEEHAWRMDRLNARHRREIRESGGTCDAWSHRNNRACPTPKNRLALASTVQLRFGSDAVAIGYSREDNGNITLWDVRDRHGNVLWDSMDPDVGHSPGRGVPGSPGHGTSWSTLGDAVMLLGACLYASEQVGDGLVYPLTTAPAR
jgi:hypothetical protein